MSTTHQIWTASTGQLWFTYQNLEKTTNFSGETNGNGQIWEVALTSKSCWANDSQEPARDSPTMAEGNRFSQWVRSQHGSMEFQPFQHGIFVHKDIKDFKIAFRSWPLMYLKYLPLWLLRHGSEHLWKEAFLCWTFGRSAPRVFLSIQLSSSLGPPAQPSKPATLSWDVGKWSRFDTMFTWSSHPSYHASNICHIRH